MKYSKPIAVVILSLLAPLMLSSCLYKSSNHEAELPITQISLYSFDRQNYEVHHDRVLDYIEKQNGIDLEIQTGVWDDSQMDVLIAAGEYPDVITIVDSENPGRFNKWVRDGNIIPFTDELIEGLPHLQQVLSDPRLAELQIDGQFYGLPIKDELPMNSPGQHVFIIRKDWLEHLAMPAPESLEQLEQLLLKFKYDDPDSNQLDDTFGLISDGLTSIVKSIMGSWGIPVDARSTGFLQVGDHYEYWVVQPEVKEALRFVRNLYEQKLIHPDTLSASSNVQIRPRFIESRVGIIIDNINFEEIVKKEEQLQRNIPDAELMSLPGLAGPEGKRGYSVGSGYWGYTVITDKSENPRAVAELLDYLLSEEGEKLTLYGVPEIHYTDTNGTISLNMEERNKDVGFRSATIGAPHELNWGIVSWSRMTEKPYLILRDLSIPHFSTLVEENLDRVSKYLVYPASYTISTPQWISFKANSDQLYEEYFNKIILGQLDLDSGFAEFVSKWKSSGGDSAMKEMSDAIKASK